MMAEPLMTEDEYQREYGDIHHLAKVRSLTGDEVKDVRNFHVKKLQLVLAKSGVFHLSLKKAFLRFNNRLLAVRKEATMDNYDSLRKEAEWIEKHLEYCRKLIRGYYGVVKRMMDDERHIEQIVGHYVPPYIDPALDKEQRRKAAELSSKIKSDLVHVAHVLVMLDNLFTDELLRLVQMLRAQVAKTHDNIFNYAAVNRLFEEMNSKFDRVLSQAAALPGIVGETEKDLSVRYEIVQRVLEARR